MVIAEFTITTELLMHQIDLYVRTSNTCVKICVYPPCIELILMFLNNRKTVFFNNKMLRCLQQSIFTVLELELAF
jgi:hypothetical protein